MLLDDRLHLGYLNMAAQDILEISGRQASQLSFDEIFIAADEDVNEIRSALVKRSSFTKRNAEFQLCNGKRINLDYTVNCFEEAGQAYALLELHTINQSIHNYHSESLDSTHATTRELVRGLAHEIKNPLGGIRGAAQLLAKELSNEELSDYTNVIIEEADRLHNLVDRLVGSKKLPEIKDINIHVVLERVRKLVEAETSDQSIELLRDYDPSIPAIRGDEEQLIQATLNIVRNAMQALHSPGVEHTLGKISLSTRILRNTTIGNEFHKLIVCIEIHDNGPGIPEQLINTIFYPMISGRADGTGLGLSITHNIITQHRGLISCKSAPGDTCFSILLPITPDQ